MFSRSGSYVEDENTGERISLREHGGNVHAETMDQKPVFSEACRRNMVKTSSEAVRPSLNVASQEETNKNSLGHHGETDVDI